MIRSRQNRSRSSSRSAKNNQLAILPPSTSPTTKPTPTAFEKILYENSAHQTDFFVLLDYAPKNNEANARKRINELKLFQILQQINLIEGFKQVKRIGFRRCKVLFDTAAQANKVINAEVNLRCHNLRAFNQKILCKNMVLLKKCQNHLQNAN